MIKIDQNNAVNPKHISHMRWDQRHYANGPGDAVLVIVMAGGDVFRVKHEPHLLGGTDAYAVERKILAYFEEDQADAR